MHRPSSENTGVLLTLADGGVEHAATRDVHLSEECEFAPLYQDVREHEPEETDEFRSDARIGADPPPLPEKPDHVRRVKVFGRSLDPSEVKFQALFFVSTLWIEEPFDFDTLRHVRNHQLGLSQPALDIPFSNVSLVGIF